MRIPVTMCHGVSWRPRSKWAAPHGRLTRERFAQYFAIAAGLGFESIGYGRLAEWRAGEAALPARPILFDFDHPDASICSVVHPLMERHGFRGNLFVNTAPLEKTHAAPGWMSWDEIGRLAESGWTIGSHTHNHFDLAWLARKDPSGEAIREQLERCDELIQRRLGITPRDFAYTSTTWSRLAEREVARRYRFARLWITGAHYDTDRGRVRYADLVGSGDADESDGGPPLATRYVTESSDPLKLPSMELEHLIFETDAYRRYLEGARA